MSAAAAPAPASPPSASEGERFARPVGCRSCESALVVASSRTAGAELLRQLEAQAATLHEGFQIDLRVRAIAKSGSMLLDDAGIDYESRFFPKAGHGLGRGAGKTQWEFFDRILKPQSATLEAVL